VNSLIGPRRRVAGFRRRSAAVGVVAALFFGGTLVTGAGTAFAALADSVSLSQSNASPFVGSNDVFSARVTSGGAAVAGDKVKFSPSGGLLPNEAYVGIANHAGGGYWLAGIDGAVLPEGGAPDYAPPRGNLTIAIAPTVDGGGYWLLHIDGTITPEGDAVSSGDASASNFAAIAIAGGPDTHSYWILLADGTVMHFGTAAAAGPFTASSAPVIGLATNPTHTAVTVCAADGSCQGFGAGAPTGNFSIANPNNALTAVAADSAGTGMWGLLSDNTTVTVGSASGGGNVSDHNTPMVDLAPGPDAASYLVVGLDGQVVKVGTAANVGDAFTQVTNAQGVATLTVTSFAANTTTMFSTDLPSGVVSNHLNTTWIIPPGYWMAGSDGGVFQFGVARFFGSKGGSHLNQPIVGMASTPDGGGYWLVAADGGIFPFGDATYQGSTGNRVLNKPIVGMAPTPDGGGYWLVAADGGIFPFGDATYHGSTGNRVLNKPIVGMAATSTGSGYWLVASDGGIFPFGDAGYLGSTGNRVLNKPVVGMASPDDGGYWLVASDGGIFPFGDAVYEGSTGNRVLNKPIVAMTPTADGNGYWLIASDGGVFPFGDAVYGGSLGAQHLNAPIVGAASFPFPLLDLSAASTTTHPSLNRATVDSVLDRKGIHWAG
jgi:hypothetical protein